MNKIIAGPVILNFDADHPPEPYALTGGPSNCQDLAPWQIIVDMAKSVCLNRFSVHQILSNDSRGSAVPHKTPTNGPNRCTLYSAGCSTTFGSCYSQIGIWRVGITIGAMSCWSS